MLEASKVETLYGMQNIDEEKQAALLAENEKAIAATLAAKAKSGKKGKKNYERGAGIDDATLVTVDALRWIATIFDDRTTLEGPADGRLIVTSTEAPMGEDGVLLADIERTWIRRASRR